MTLVSCRRVQVVLIMTLFTLAATLAKSKAFTIATTAAPRTSNRALAELWTRSMASASSEKSSIVDICSQKIKAALDADEVKVTGAYDDPNGSHISIEVVSSQFEGKRAVQRQQLVYKAIWEELQGPVHAVDSMICKTPSET